MCHWLTLRRFVSAFGVALTYVATSEVLALNFEKYKYLAFATAIIGYYVGMVIFPLISQELLEAYGYSTAMGIMALFQVIHVIAGILFFEPTKQGELNGK